MFLRIQFTPIVDIIILILIIELIIYIGCLIKIWYHIILIIILLELIRIKIFLASRIRVISSSIIVFLILVVIVIEARLGLGSVVGLTRAWGEESVIIWKSIIINYIELQILRC